MVLKIKTIFPSFNYWQDKRSSDELKKLDNLIEKFWERVPQRQTKTDKMASEYLQKCKRQLREANLPPEQRNHLFLVQDLCISTLQCNQNNKADRSLYERLDIVIEILAETKNVDTELLSINDKESLKELQKFCREFISVVANKAEINDEEILSLQKKRQIDFTYLPNHLPAHLNEPQYPDQEKQYWGLSKEELVRYHSKIRLRNFKREKFEYFKQIDTAVDLFERWSELLKKIDENNKNSDKARREKETIQKALQQIKQFLSTCIGKVIKNDEEIALIQSQRKKNHLFPFVEKIDAIIDLYEKCSTQLTKELNEHEKSTIAFKQKEMLAFLSEATGRSITSAQDVQDLKHRREKNKLFPILDEEVDLNKISDQMLQEIFELKFKEQRIQETYSAYKAEKLLRVTKTNYLNETLPKWLLEIEEKLKEKELLIKQSSGRAPKPLKVSVLQYNKKVLSTIHVYHLYANAVEAYKRFKKTYPDSPDPFKAEIDPKKYDISEEDRKIFNWIRTQKLTIDEIINPLNPFDNQKLLMKYLNAAEREKFRMLIHDGVICKLASRPSGLKIVPASTKENISHRKKGWVSFVMTNKGEIFAGPHIINMSYLHSSFSNGSWVSFAGEMKIGTDGKILAISLYSGHYGPSQRHLEEFIRHLVSKNVDLSQCVFYVFDDERKKAKSEELDKLAEIKSEQEMETLQIKFDHDKELLKYSIPHKYQSEVGLVPIKPMELKTKIFIGFGIVLGLLSLTALILCPLLLVGSAAIAGVVSGAAVFGANIIFLAKVSGLMDKCVQFFKGLVKTRPQPTEKSNKQSSSVRIKKSRSVPDLFMYRTFQKNSLSLPKNANHQALDLPAASTEASAQPKNDKQFNNQIKSIPIQFSFIGKEYSQEDANFGSKWGVANPKKDYPEWCEFIEFIKDSVKNNNFRLVDNHLVGQLNKLTERFYDSSKGEYFAIPPGEVWIWKEQNLVKLFSEIARELIFSPDVHSLKKLDKVEKDVFKPVIESVKIFMELYSKIPTNIHIFDLYVVERNRIHQERYPLNNISCRTESNDILPSEQEYKTITSQV